MKGKRGPQPLDPVQDFEQAVRKDPQAPLIEMPDQGSEPDAPQAEVKDGMVLMQFVRVKLSREKDGKRFVGLELSVGLTPESAQLFGRDIEGRFDILTDDPGVTGLTIRDAKPHTIDIAEATTAAPAVHGLVDLQRVSLTAVQEKGSGEERTVIRLSFVAVIPQTDALLLWAASHHGELVWTRMSETQRSFASKG